jgi:hypothetical protein
MSRFRSEKLKNIISGDIPERILDVPSGWRKYVLYQIVLVILFFLATLCWIILFACSNKYIGRLALESPKSLILPVAIIASGFIVLGYEVTKKSLTQLLKNPHLYPPLLSIWTTRTMIMFFFACTFILTFNIYYAFSAVVVFVIIDLWACRSVTQVVGKYNHKYYFEDRIPAMQRREEIKKRYSSTPDNLETLKEPVDTDREQE